MREIKFRAWDSKQNKMITSGYDYHLQLVRRDIGVDGWDGAIHQQTPKEAELFPLMQYTGLNDKNGVEIYEGDLLRVVAKSWSGNYGALLMECRFNNESLGFSMYVVDREGNADGFGNMYAPHVWEDKLEVIGNIYENAELLND